MLKHDLHKIYKGAPKHSEALHDAMMQKADGIAAWFSRNFAPHKFNNDFIRVSLIKNHNMNNYMEFKQLITKEALDIFNEKNPVKLHDLILTSKTLNQYSEAITYPYTSLKYHLLISNAIYYNLVQGFDTHRLYLCENQPPESPFQIIYKDNHRTWALLPTTGMSRISSKFNETWVRRTQKSIGGDRVLDGLLSSIPSWSTALATLEDCIETQD